MKDRWLIAILFLQVVVSYVLFLVTKSSLFLIGVIASAVLVFVSVLASGNSAKKPRLSKRVMQKPRTQRPLSSQSRVVRRHRVATQRR